MISVSCLCPTYGRFHLLEEAVESFLRQDYTGDSELIILNDLDAQHIEYSHPRVRVINTSTRFPNLGSKRNHIASLAKNKLMLTWGDDDIHLPNRITRMVENIGDKPFMLEGWHYCSYGNELYLNRFCTMGAHAVLKDFYFEIGGVPEKNTGEDVGFNEKVKKILGGIEHAKDNPAFWYRWSGTNRPHISAYHDSKNKIDSYQIVKNRIGQLIDSKQEPSGELILNPKWHLDYNIEKHKAIIK